MIIDANMEVPTLPMLSIQRPLTLLKPCVLEKLERAEEHRNRAQSVFLGRAVPIFDDRCEGTHLFRTGRLLPK